MKNENKTISNPIMPYIRVCLAPSSFFGSPAVFIYLYPPNIKRKSAKVPTNIKSAVTIFEKIAGIQLRVATCPVTAPVFGSMMSCRHFSRPLTLFQSVNIIREYQRRREKTRIAGFN